MTTQRPSKAPPGALLVALAGAAVGAMLGALLAIGMWMVRRPDASGGDAWDMIRTGSWDALTSQLVAIAAVGGFIYAGLRVENRLVTNLASGFGRTLGILAGGLFGAAVGLLVHVLVWTALGLAPSLSASFSITLDMLGRPTTSATLFGFAGMISGVLVTTVVVAQAPLRVAARMATGGLVGAVVGLLLYSIAYVIIRYPDFEPSLTYVLYFAQAVYSFAPVEFLFLAIGATAGAALSRYAWRIYGLLTFVSLLCVVIGYVLWSVSVGLPEVPAAQRPFSYTLFAAEFLSLLMVLLYSFYTIDVAARKRWVRHPQVATFSAYYLPKVAIQVPTYNEPPELVQETLSRLLDLDYPKDRYVIMVGDDSTKAECQEPLRAFCARNGIVYNHRTDRTGYKAGALNKLLEVTPADATLIAVVDADYQIEPDYLRETVGYFIDPDLGWLQTPQDYRNRHESFLTEQYYLADAYFYRTILPSRNEENSIIFCGTMGILRKWALREVGGWNEQCITEDAELSVRLLNAGWGSLYVNKTYGRGLIPASFEGYQRQHYRWAFGGGRILRTHFGRLLFGRFTFRQRLDYIVGTLNWFEGVFLFGIAMAVFGMAMADLLGFDVMTHHEGEILLIGLIPLFLLLDGLTRVHFVLRRSINLTFGGTLRILGMWFSVKFSNMRAAIKALAGFSIPFIRTKKNTGDRMTKMASLERAVGLTKFESTVACILFLGACAMAVKMYLVRATEPESTRIFLTMWLFYYTLVFLAAPLYAYKSFVTLPEGDGLLFQAARPPGPAPAPPTLPPPVPTGDTPAFDWLRRPGIETAPAPPPPPQAARPSQSEPMNFLEALRAKVKPVEFRSTEAAPVQAPRTPAGPAPVVVTAPNPATVAAPMRPAPAVRSPAAPTGPVVTAVLGRQQATAAAAAPMAAAAPTAVRPVPASAASAPVPSLAPQRPVPASAPAPVPVASPTVSAPVSPAPAAPTLVREPGRHFPSPLAANFPLVQPHSETPVTFTLLPHASNVPPGPLEITFADRLTEFEPPERQSLAPNNQHK